MDNGRMNELLVLYDNTLLTMGVPRVEHRHEARTTEQRLQHLRWLIDDLQHGNKVDEADRLIQFGMIQGGLWTEGVYQPLILQQHRQKLLDVVPSTQ